MSSRQVVRIGDGGRWTFLDGAWIDGSRDSLLVPKHMLRHDGPAIQGHHYAFLRDAAYGEIHLRFQFRHFPHSDVGIIFGAEDPSRFFLLHFPDCGQASRAANFWGALSHMEGDGYLRILKMELVRRVASTNRIWHEAEVHISQGALRLRIDASGLFEALHPALGRPGRVGLYLFNGADLRRVFLEGQQDSSTKWNADPRPPRNWFHPYPDTRFGKWQRPRELVRTPRGDLLLNFGVQEEPYRGRITHLFLRSADNGRTWSEPEEPQGLPAEGGRIIHVFPDSQLRMLILRENASYIAESMDDGRTWSKPERIALPPPPPGLDRIHPGPLLNLSDGSTLMFGYGRHGSSSVQDSIFSWGSHHCQAFACRSTDGGISWSSWVNLDGTRDTSGQRIGGNLDLTEVCGVETSDGSILALIRPIYSPWMWETWSRDGGRTWGPCLRGPFPGYATSNMVRTSSGALVVAHRLPGCTIHVSWDDGRTWDGGTMIDSAIWVMGSMLEVAPDLLLYVYWDSFESLMRAQFIRITREGPVPVRREEL